MLNEYEDDLVSPEDCPDNCSAPGKVSAYFKCSFCGTEHFPNLTIEEQLEFAEKRIKHLEGVEGSLALKLSNMEVLLQRIRDDFELTVEDCRAIAEACLGPANNTTPRTDKG